MPDVTNENVNNDQVVVFVGNTATLNTAARAANLVSASIITPAPLVSRLSRHRHRQQHSQHHVSASASRSSSKPGIPHPCPGRRGAGPGPGPLVAFLGDARGGAGKMLGPRRPRRACMRGSRSRSTLGSAGSCVGSSVGGSGSEDREGKDIPSSSSSVGASIGPSLFVPALISIPVSWRVVFSISPDFPATLPGSVPGTPACLEASVDPPPEPERTMAESTSELALAQLPPAA
jgi:hypothetical protein